MKNYWLSGIISLFSVFLLLGFWLEKGKEPELTLPFPYQPGLSLEEPRPIINFNPDVPQLFEEYQGRHGDLLRKRGCSIYGCDVDAAISRNVTEINSLKHAAKWEEAKAALDQLELSYNQSSAVHEAVGGYHYDKKNWADCARHWALAMELDSSRKYLLGLMGLVYKSAKDMPNAWMWYNKQLDENPTYDAVLGLLEISLDWSRWDKMDWIIEYVHRETRKELDSGQIPKIGMFIGCICGLPVDILQRVAAAQSLKTRQDVIKTNGGLEYEHDKSIRRRGDKIRIGWVSYDFRTHAVGVWAQGFFSFHSDDFDVWCFDNNGEKHDDGVFRRIEQACDHMVQVAGKSAKELGDLIYEAKIDVLVDIGLWTAGNRMDVFTLKPAPIQIAAMGFASTTGGPWYDYVVGDHVVIPPQFKQFYTEHILFMPWTFHIWYHRYMYDIKPALPRSSFHITQDKFAFCNFVNNFRLTPEPIDQWMRILRQTQSILVMKDFGDGSKENIINYLKSKHADISLDRVFWMPGTGGAEHIQQKGGYCDVFLDLHHYDGHSTSADALWAGLPILTYMGDDFAARVGGSFMRSFGVAELDAASWDEYVSVAVKLSADKEFYRSVRTKIEEQRSTAPLFDMARYVRNFEGGVELAYNMWLSGHPLTDVDVIDQGPLWNGVRQNL